MIFAKLQFGAVQMCVTLVEFEIMLMLKTWILKSVLIQPRTILLLGLSEMRSPNGSGHWSNSSPQLPPSRLCLSDKRRKLCSKIWWNIVGLLEMFSRLSWKSTSSNSRNEFKWILLVSQTDSHTQVSRWDISVEVPDVDAEDTIDLSSSRKSISYPCQSAHLRSNNRVSCPTPSKFR